MKKFDAENKTIGRIATEVARALMGKDEPNYAPNVVSSEKVQIFNASKAQIAPKKLQNKQYDRYTGHPGGLKIQTLAELIKRKGHEEVFKKAIYGMLPNNKLRKLRMNNLEIID